MPAKIKLEEALKRFNLLNDSNITMDIDTYQSMGKKCRFIDGDYGEWWTLPRYVIRKKCKHPKRALAIQSEDRKISIKEVKERIKKIHKNDIIIDGTTYNGITKKSRFIDKDYGEFYSIVQHICNGHSHPKKGIIKCALSNTANIDSVIKKVKKIYGNTVK